MENDILDNKNFTIDAIEKKINEKDVQESESRSKASFDNLKKKNDEMLMSQQAKKLAQIGIKQKEKEQAEIDAGIARMNMLKIRKYLDNFPFLIEKLPRMSTKPSLAESAELLGMIREIMNTTTSFASICGYCEIGFNILESIDYSFMPKPFQLDLHGITQQFRSGKLEEMLPLLKEINIEYPWLGSQSLPMRIVSTLTKVLIKVDFLNKHPSAKKAESLEEEKPIDINEEGEEEISI